MQDLENSNQDLEDSLGIAVGWESHDECLVRSGPRQTTAQLAGARQAFLEHKELESKLETQRRSLPQVASALRCWHRFAVDVLSYDESATLPPSCADDVVKYLQIFSIAGTASNYMVALRWSCKAFSKDMSWSTSELSLKVECLQKRDVRTRLAELPPKLRMAEDTIFKLVKLSADLKDSEWSAMACWSYRFLLRVQSEAVPLEAGSLADA